MESLEEISAQTDDSEARPTLDSVVRGNVAFALDLYRELQEGEGNLFFSPHSISTALAMSYAGARGNTASQMARTLHFGLDQEHLHRAFAALEARLKSVQKEGQIALKVANSLWPQAGYAFLQEYVALIQEHYGVMITSVDYVNDAEAAPERINTWVAERTEDKIQDLIPQGILDALTRLVLVNAIYFKGNWANQFDQASTQDAPFQVTAAEKVLVPMMAQEAEFGYAEWDGLQALEVPYVGDGLSMFVLLPGEVDGLGQLEATLTLENLDRWTTNLRKRKVRVFLPRFKMTSQFTLNNTLIAMGMADAFDMGKADFSGMDGRKAWLYIAAAIHKAFIEVNEEGTEAAAATAVIMGVRSMPLPPPTFRADHPFLFLVRENSTGSILFLGRMADPSSGVV
jgi:serine protease inhibitor